MTHSPEKYLMFKAIYYKWTSTVIKLHLESKNNSVYLAKLMKFIEFEKKGLERLWNHRKLNHTLWTEEEG